MASLIRSVPQWRLSAGRMASASAARPVLRRTMHASPALDPTERAPVASMEDFVVGAATDEAEASASSSSSSSIPLSADDFVHVKLSYLHPSTKEPAKNPRRGDIKSGRVRAEKSFVPLSSYVFAMQPRRDVLHSAVVYYLDGLRQGTASTKTRSEVAFSGRKLRPQKGTGQARLGTASSPLLRKGGVAHGPRPRNFATKLNRRVRELALRSALSLRWRAGDLHVVKNLDWQAPPHNCNPLSRLLKAKGWADALFLTAPRSPEPGQGVGRTGKSSAVDPVYGEEAIAEHARDVRNFASALGNIPQTEMIKLNDLTSEAHEKAKKTEERKRPGELHAYEVLARKKVICDLGAIEWLEEKMGGALLYGTEEELMSLEALGAEEAQLAADLERLQFGAEQGQAGEGKQSQSEGEELRAAEDEAIRRETERVMQDLPGESSDETKKEA